MLRFVILSVIISIQVNEGIKVANIHKYSAPKHIPSTKPQTFADLKYKIIVN